MPATSPEVRASSSPQEKLRTLEAFVLDDDLRRLERSLGKFNLFTTLRLHTNELVHSRMLGCPWELQPLVELLYRGTIWTHPNDRDWTLEAFFQSSEGLGLDMAGDEKTRESLRAAIAVLAKTPVEQLRSKGRLEAGDFDDIVVGDTPRDLLTWIGGPDAARKEWGEERWHAFRSRCRDKYNFDPGTEAPLYAAEKLGRREVEAWRQLWDRFCEAPGIYQGVKDALDRAQPSDVLALDPESWPTSTRRLIP